MGIRQFSKRVRQEAMRGWGWKGVVVVVWHRMCTGGTDASEKETLKQIQTLQRVISMTGELSSNINKSQYSPNWPE